MNERATPFIEAIKEIVRQLTLLIIALIMTSGIDIAVSVLGDLELGGVYQIGLTGLIQLLLRGRDKYKYYEAKQKGEEPNPLLMLK